MRLIHTFNDPNLAQEFASFLLSQGIEYQLEQNINNDWGSTNYGNITTDLWIINEDDLDKVTDWFAEFDQNPFNPKFKVNTNPVELAPANLEEEPQTNPASHFSNKRIPGVPHLVPQQPLGPVTMYCLLLCILLFLFSGATTPEIENRGPLSNLLYPALMSPVKKALLYDYPYAFEVIDRFIETQGIEKLQGDTIAPEARELLEKVSHTPYWQGFYEKFLFHLKNPDSPWDFTVPMFEKIRQGEIWRVMSPAFLHSDLFHLFFNMIWLIVIGKQIEQRLGKWRYILFILLAGIFSNTAQYLMSGFNFLGFSGILCAMITFIWVRQKEAAWEGYQLQGATIGFILFFIFTMFALQLISFGLEVAEQATFTPGVANTAHLSGAFLGYFLGKIPYFSWRGLS